MHDRNDLPEKERELWDLISSEDRAHFDGNGAKINAEVICQFLLGIGMTPRCRTLTLENIIVVGQVDLESARLLFTIAFVKCQFEQRVNLEQAHASTVYFNQCTLAGISADQLQTKFSFMLRNCVDTGGISLIGAHIGGRLNLAGSKLHHQGKFALMADGLVVDQNMRCSTGFEAEGCVRMIGARIGGQFSCDNGTFHNPGNIALDASGLVVGEHVYFTHGFTSTGRIKLTGARIEGELDCTGGKFHNGADITLQFDGLTVLRDLKFATGSVVDGGVDLTGGRIGGKLDLTGGTFLNSGKTALDLARAYVAQNLICHGGTEVRGKVLLAGAEIGGNLWCEGGKFHNPTGDAIDATGVTVRRSIAFSAQQDFGSFLAEGRVVLNDANVGGSLRCTGGRFDHPGGVALLAQGLTVTRDVLLCGGFYASGEVDLMDSEIGGKLNCCGGQFHHRPEALTCDRVNVKHSVEFGEGFLADGTVSLRGAHVVADLAFTKAMLGAQPHATALTLRSATVGGTFKAHFEPRPVGAIDLVRAKVGQLDDRAAKWPNKVHLHDFVYRTLTKPGAGGPTVRDRLKWLRSNHHYVPQIYLQLSLVYQAAGFDGSATEVAIAGEDARRSARTGVVGIVQQVLGLLFKMAVQYGYRPLQVVWWLLLLEIVGAVAFGRLHVGGQIKPRADAPDFNSWLYTLDLLVPVVSLKQRDYWIPHSGAAWWASIFTFAGWGLALALVVGVGRIFKAK